MWSIGEMIFQSQHNLQTDLNFLYLQYLKKRALRRLENEQIAQDFAVDNSGQTEVKMKPKRISGIVTIPQHEQVLQQQLSQIHHASYAVFNTS
jgi:hypothetical protein